MCVCGGGGGGAVYSYSHAPPDEFLIDQFEYDLKYDMKLVGQTANI